MRDRSHAPQRLDNPRLTAQCRMVQFWASVLERYALCVGRDELVFVAVCGRVVLGCARNIHVAP